MIVFVPIQEDSRGLEKLVKDSRNHNFSIWFGHYPLSTVSGHFSYKRNLLRYASPLPLYSNAYVLFVVLLFVMIILELNCVSVILLHNSKKV